MTVMQVFQQAMKLSTRDRIELIKLIVGTLDESEPESTKRHSIMELKGLGKEIWEGVDVAAYINELRDEWDKRET